MFTRTLLTAFLLLLLVGACDARAVAQQEAASQQASSQQAAARQTAKQQQQGRKLDYTTSWLGNSLPGSDGWVLQAVDDIFVTPDGTVYTNVEWDEHGINVSAYRDGAFVAEARVGNHGGGHTITANDEYIFFAGDEHRTGNPGIDRRDRRDIRDKGTNVHTDAGPVYGLAATDSAVYASVPAEGQIKVYDLGLNQQSSFSVESPGELALGADETLWVVQDSARVARFSRQGERLPQAVTPPQDVVPTDIAVDSEGRLLVTDIGPREQVRVYEDVAAEPAFAGALGEEGGVYAGDTPGRKGPGRLYKPMGVGTDAEGNIYIGNKAGYHENGATLLQSYAFDESGESGGDPSLGALNWELQASLWIDVVGMDPTDESVLYGSGERFSMDYSKPAGQEATLEAYTANRHAFPEDDRGRGATWMRMVEGEKLMYLSSMDGLPVRIYRFEPETHGEVAVPAGRIAGDELWIDQNGDGHRNPGEAQPLDIGSGQGGWVDSEGTVWAADPEGIDRLPVQGLNEHGVPQYTTASASHYDPPGDYEALRRIRFYPERGNMMILSGFTEEYPNVSHHFKRAGKVFRRYDGWQPGGNDWERTWQLVPPFEDRETGNSGDGNIQVLSVAGDYLFFARNGSSPNMGYERGHVDVYTLDTKEYVGWMEPAPIVASGNPNGPPYSNVGIIDINDGMQAFQRTGGEYLIFWEDDWNTKNVLYRWCPSDDCTEGAGQVVR